MIVPATMTMPMLESMPPKPFFTVERTFAAGIPQTRPTKIETRTSTRNGCCLNLLMARIMAMTASKITLPINRPDIIVILLNK